MSLSGQHTVATRDTEYPNGLAFSPDESVLYVAITRRDEACIAEKERGEVCEHQFIRAFDVANDGSLSNNRIFAEMHSAEDGVPDGMKVDAAGRIYCTGPGGCWVFDASGNHLGHHRAAGNTRELCMGRRRQPHHALHRPYIGLFAAHVHLGNVCAHGSKRVKCLVRAD